MPSRMKDFARTLYEAQISVPDRNFHKYVQVLDWLILASAYRRRLFRGCRARRYLNLAIDRLNFMHSTNMPGLTPFWHRRPPAIVWVAVIIAMVLGTTATVMEYRAWDHPSTASTAGAAWVGTSSEDPANCPGGQDVSDLGSLPIGDTDYTAIWAVYFINGHLMVDSGYPASSCPSDVMTTRVERMHGYVIVWPVPGQPIQSRTSADMPEFEPGIPAVFGP